MDYATAIIRQNKITITSKIHHAKPYVTHIVSNESKYIKNGNTTGGIWRYYNRKNNIKNQLLNL